MKSDKEKIFEMVIREMTENVLSCRRENLEEGEQQLYTEVGFLSIQAGDIINEFVDEHGGLGVEARIGFITK